MFEVTHAPRLALLSIRTADLYARMIATIRSMNDPWLGSGTSLSDRPWYMANGAYGLSHDPLLAERNRASMTRMFKIASSIGNSSGVALMIAREKASPCSVY